MKMISIICNISVVSIIVDMINKFNVDNYQIIEEIHTKPVIGSPRLNTAIWPGYSSMINFQYQNNEKLLEIIRGFEEYNSSAVNDSERIEISVWTLDNYICK
jgi:hypothetical protein